LKTTIYVIFGKMFKFRGKIPYIIFDPQNGTLTEIFLATGGGGVALGSSKKIFLGALFFRKVPLRAWPPQLFEASYAPALNNF
jgi:hypothetical protein